MALDFTIGDIPGQQKVLLASDNGEITEQALVDSLGDHASQYVVKGVTKQ